MERSTTPLPARLVHLTKPRGAKPAVLQTSAKFALLAAVTFVSSLSSASQLPIPDSAIAGRMTHGQAVPDLSQCTAPRFALTEPFTLADRARAVAVADLDGNGSLDVVLATDQVNRLHLTDNTVDPMVFSTQDIGTDSEFSFSLAVGDVDSDGDLDVVTGNVAAVNRLYLNNGTSTPFAGVSSGIPIDSSTDDSYAIALGDVNGDGDLDLVVGNFRSPSLLYLNNGSADPFDGVVPEPIESVNYRTADVELVDADDDGALDLLVINGGQANKLYQNNGSESPFSDPPTDIGNDSNDSRRVAIGDVDNDGDPDLAVSNFRQANVLYLNNGTTDPFSDVGSGLPIGIEQDATIGIGFGDIDNDGDLDLITGNQFLTLVDDPVRLRLYLNEAGTLAAVGEPIDANPTSIPSELGLGDFDNDGDDDLLSANTIRPVALHLNLLGEAMFCSGFEVP